MTLREVGSVIHSSRNEETSQGITRGIHPGDYKKIRPVPQFCAGPALTHGLCLTPASLASSMQQEGQTVNENPKEQWLQ